MARNGSGTFVTTDGTYTGPNVHAQQKAAAVKITASRMDATIEDIAAGLTQSISKDGQTTITADLPMASHKLTGLSAGSANGHSVRYEQLAETINPSGANLTLGPSSAHDIQFQSGGSGRFKWDDSDVSLLPNTSLAYDIGLVASLWRAVYTALVHSGANELILSSGASGGISFRVSTFVCWRLNEFTGGLDQNATNGGDITFSKNNTGVNETVAGGLTATGTVAGDALLLAKRVNILGTVASGTGVKLPATIPVGGRITIANHGLNTLTVYCNTGHTIVVTGGASITVGASMGVELIGISSTTWNILVLTDSR